MKGLGEREEALRAAEQRRAEYDKARSMKPREYARLQAEQMVEDERVGAGGERDLGLEERLAEELRELERELDRETVEIPLEMDSGFRSSVRTEMVDRRAEAAWKGADSAVKDAQAELRTFVKENLSRIAVELAPRAAEIQEQATALLRECRRVAVEEQKLTGLFPRLFTLANREALIATCPPSSFEWLRDAPRVAYLPLPEAFVR
jgi:hypothetical protein